MHKKEGCEMKGTLSRRTFVAAAAAIGGSIALSACVQEGSMRETYGESGPVDVLETDVVVLGAGLAGLGAAGAAALGGADVVLVEKGSSLLSAFWPSPGNLGIAQLPENEDAWIFTSDVPDTTEDFLARWKEQTEVGYRDVAYPDYERMIDTMTEACRTVSWMEDLRLPFEKSMDKSVDGVDGVRPVVNAESDHTGGQRIGDVFDAVLQENGATMLFESAGVELAIEGGDVVGVVVEGPQGRQTVHAKAVVLATGGYAGSEEYRKKYIPEAEAAGCRFVGLPFNTGDSMTMASAAGAALYEDGWIIPSSLAVSEALVRADFNLDWLEAPETGMFVDATGVRFANEAAGPTTLATTMVDSKRGPYYVLFDSSEADAAALIERGLSTGEAFKGGTIEELAAAAEMDALAAAFASYQDSAASGTDAEFNKPAKHLKAYKDGPYYLVRFVPSYVATMGGVKTNANCQAITEDGTPINGLFVVGESTHRFLYNRSFIPACSNGSGITMGRLTGEYLATLI